MQFQNRLLAYLRSKDVPFTIRHLEEPRTATTRPFNDGWQEGPLIRVVLAFIGKHLTMLVMRDDQQVDLERLQNALLGRDEVTLVDSKTFGAAFPEVELSALPPLGELWRIPVLIDAELADVSTVRFFAGSHADIVTLRHADLCRLSKPTSLNFAVPKKIRIPLTEHDGIHTANAG
jgi:Ala-tRNA(Pro) deacylase